MRRIRGMTEMAGGCCRSMTYGAATVTGSQQVCQGTSLQRDGLCSSLTRFGVRPAACPIRAISAPKCAPPKLRNFAGSAVSAKVNFGGHSAAAHPALSRVDICGHSAAAKVILAAEAQPAKLRKVGGYYHLGANDEHAAVLTPPKLRNIGGSRAGRRNSVQISGFAR